MSDKIHEEVINSWNSWKYDILDMNKSNWSKDDQLTLETIEQILNDELKNTIKLVSLEGEVRMLRKELDDRKTND
jgi:hypothetical protein